MFAARNQLAGGGIISLWPMTIRLGSSIPLALLSASTLTPYRLAIENMVSPAATTWKIGVACGAGDGEVAGVRCGVGEGDASVAVGALVAVAAGLGTSVEVGLGLA